MGQALVFIHGAGGSAKHWHPLLSALNTPLPVYLYELPGHGDREDTVAPNMSSAVADFSQFIEKHQLGEFHLIAHSLGGLIAMQYALAFPAKVENLVLISTAAKILMHPDFINQIYSGNIDQEFLREGFAGKITEQSKQQVIDDFSRLKFSGQSADFMDVAQCNLNQELERILQPTLVMIGESDRIISPRRSRELSHKIPDAKLEIIPQSAHYPQLENVEITAHLIKEYFDEQKSCL